MQSEETSTGRIETPYLMDVEVAYEVRRVVQVWAFDAPEAKRAARAPGDWADAGTPHEMMDTVRVVRPGHYMLLNA